MDILKKLNNLEHEAEEYGFKWETSEQIIAQIHSELAEIEEHLIDGNKIKLQEEIGDLLHAVLSLCIFYQFDTNETLEKIVTKFEKRFRIIQKLATESGLDNLNGQPFTKLMEFWDKAKQQNK